MATVKAISSKATLKRATDYITNKEKTNDDLIEGINCRSNTARIEMETIQRAYEKTDGRTYKHFTLNYHKDDNITPEQCLQNAKKLCEETKAFKGHQILIAVHTDKEHLHAHMIVSSVNMENGKKLQWSNRDLQNFKDRSDQICREQGLKVTQKGKTYEGKDNGNTSTYTKEAYKSITDDKNSWVVKTGLAVIECRQQATSKEDFIEKMKEKGYEVKWTDKRKNITFTDIERQKNGEKKCSIRDTKLEQHFHIDFRKESLTSEFERNLRARAEREKGAELTERSREAVARVYRSTGNSTSGERSGADQSGRASGHEQRITETVSTKNINDTERKAEQLIAESRERQIAELDRKVDETIRNNQQQRTDNDRDKRETRENRGKGKETRTERETNQSKRETIEHER